MKKLVLLGCALMTITQGINAQERVIVGEREPMFGVEGGINLNNTLDHYQGETTSNQAKVGFHAGVVGDFLLTDHVYLQPGLRYIMKGGQQERSYTMTAANGTMSETEMKSKITLNYVELPLNIVFKFGGNDSRFFVGVGAYAATLLDAKNKYKSETTVGTGDNKVEMPKVEDTKDMSIGSKDGDDYPRMDYGLSGLVGWQMRNHWYVKGSVEAGLRNLAANRMNPGTNFVAPNMSDNTAKNISYLLTVGYMFER